MPEKCLDQDENEAFADNLFIFHWAQWADRWTGSHASIKTCASAMVENLSRDHSPPSINKHRKWHNTRLVICFSMFSLWVISVLLSSQCCSSDAPTYIKFKPPKHSIMSTELFTLVLTCLNLSLQNWQARMKIPSQNSIIYTSNTADELHSNLIPLRAILPPYIVLAVVILSGNFLVVLSYNVNWRWFTHVDLP